MTATLSHLELTHLDQNGAAAMVDVSAKPNTTRLARAGALVQTTPEVIELIARALLKKGDVLFTGTPAGVGPVSPGDRLEGFLDGESRLRVNIR